MNPVSRRELKTAVWALSGVAVLGLTLGIVNSVDPLSGASPVAGRGTSVPFNRAMANSIEAKPLAPEAAPAAPAPKPLADASALAKSDAPAGNGDDDTGPASDGAAPPTLYAPPEPGPAAPARAPSGDDNNLPPY